MSADIPTAAILPDAEWRHRAGLDKLLATLDAQQGGARFVGGAVRDTLLGVTVKDVDIATRIAPQEVLERLQRSGIKAVPTGIEHGTITAVLDGWPVEITTLRRDVSTDGRRATVAYTTDWQEDAARRDFTINALSADPISGAISDYFGGLADLAERRVRFIGDASARIAEDYLRILRFFRFLARFSTGAPDAQAYAACRAQAGNLTTLSPERIADELLRLLGNADPVPAIRLMFDGGIFAPILSEIENAGIDRLAMLVDAEAKADVVIAPVRRLAALLPNDPVVGESVATRLRLSNKLRKRIATALKSGNDVPESLAYRTGTEGAVDRLLLAGNIEDARNIAKWTIPVLPMSGGSLIARGLAAGPDVAKALREVEDQWVAEAFPGEARLSEIVDQTVSKFQRARQ